MSFPPTSTTDRADDATSEPTRGRPRDPSRDTAILDAAVELLVADGYDLVTMEHIASHAGVGKATVYRRWGSKAALVMDAVARIKPSQPTVDTGSLDGDLDQLIDAACHRSTEQASRVMCGIAAALGRDPELLAAFRTRFTQPRIQRIAEVLERAQQRGEIEPHIDVQRAAELVPSLLLQHTLFTGERAPRDYVEWAIGSVLLPALGRPHRPTVTTRSHP